MEVSNTEGKKKEILSEFKQNSANELIIELLQNY